MDRDRESFTRRIAVRRAAGLGTRVACVPRTLALRALTGHDLSHPHLAGKDHRDRLRHHSSDGLLQRLCGTSGERVHPGSAWTQSRRAGRSFPADRRRDEVHPERRFHAGQRKHLLLLARPLPRDGAGHHDDRGRAVWQHAFRRADGDCRYQRRRPLRFCHCLVRRLRDCHRGLVVELKVSIPRWGPLRARR